MDLDPKGVVNLLKNSLIRLRKGIAPALGSVPAWVKECAAGNCSGRYGNQCDRRESTALKSRAQADPNGRQAQARKDQNDRNHDGAEPNEPVLKLGDQRGWSIAGGAFPPASLYSAEEVQDPGADR